MQDVALGCKHVVSLLCRWAIAIPSHHLAGLALLLLLPAHVMYNSPCTGSAPTNGLIGTCLGSLRPICAATSGNGGAHVERRPRTRCLRMQAHVCADVYSHALAVRHAHACADVDVRACLHAPYDARCGLTCTHAQACTMTHTHHGTCARTGTPSCMTVTELRRDRAGTAPIVVHIGAGTEADLRCD